MHATSLTRTASISLSVSALLLSAALAACTTGTDSPGGAASPVDSTRSATPTASAPAGGTGIPAGALLQPPDVSGAKPQPLEDGEFPHIRPLRPCDNGRYPSDSTRTDAVAVRYNLELTGANGPEPSVVTEFVGRHSPGGAAAQFKEIGEALKRCPGDLAKGQRKWTVLGDGLAGDESMLVRIDWKVAYADEKPEDVSHYSALARVGDVIVVVTDLGWENLSGSEELVRDLIGKAVPRVQAIS